MGSMFEKVLMENGHEIWKLFSKNGTIAFNIVFGKYGLTNKQIN
jgi:hypothetical protein